MNFELIKIQTLSGSETSIYTVRLQGQQDTLFNLFLAKYMASHSAAIQKIVARLHTIGKVEGAREQYFKLKEGRPGDLVCALYDDPEAELRLYGIRYGKETIIIGSGGYKPPEIKAWQDDLTLKTHAEEMIGVSAAIYKRMSERYLEWDYKHMNFEGDHDFTGEHNDEH